MFCIMLTFGKSYGQIKSTIQWQNAYPFQLSTLKQISGGGYILSGGSVLIGGNVIIKTNLIGDPIWQKNIRVYTSNFFGCIIQTSDGGYMNGAMKYTATDSSTLYDATSFGYGENDYWIVKLDELGNKQWDRTYGSSSSDNLVKIIKTIDNGFILGGDSDGAGGVKTEYPNGSMDCWILKLNSIGDIEWDKSIGGIDQDNLRDIIQTNDGGYIFISWSNSRISLDKTEASIGNGDYWVVKLDSQGNIVWQNTIGGNGNDLPYKIIQTKDNGYAIVGVSASTTSVDKIDNGYGGGDYWVVKLDSIGNVKWQKTIGGDFEDRGTSIIEDKDEGYLVGGFSKSNIAGNKTVSRIGGADYWVIKLDNIGNILWQKAIGGTSDDQISDIQKDINGGYLLFGNSNSDISGDKTKIGSSWIVKLIIDPKYITGNIFTDNNNSCIQNMDEKGLGNYPIKASNNLNTSYSTSQPNGKYFIALSDTGQYDIELLPNSSYPYLPSSNCNLYAVHLIDTIATANFALKPQFLCPYNTVNVSTTTPFRIGRPQGYYASYCNNGTILSPNTYITIKLDSLLDLNSASIPYTTLPNHTYRFNIGNLDFLTCGNFSFVATPRINAVQLNQTLCVEAHIYPDTICTTPNYTGSYIVASAQCLGDSVELKLENRGGNMQQIKKYIVIEDQVMRINRNYQLPRNGTIIEKMPADSGHTYRIIAEQEDALPPSYGDKFATAAIEGCRPNPELNFSTGYFTQFPNYDGEPFRAVSCNVITGSYDPNDKFASPVGYATQHYIEKNTQIDYQINFQNTGNDTAFKVVVVDTISPTLDINSIQLGVASHAYQFQRTDSNVVQFVFDNILLVDSFRNEPKSHGFVKFKIQQKLNNANGTKIYNSAAIYFDYNAPIITNRTYHTVGQNFVTVQLINTIKNPKYNVKEVKVFPNPFREKTQIIVESNELKNPVLLLMNIQGQLIKTISSTYNNTFDIYREDLSNGMYLFKIMQDENIVANGKVVVQ